MSGRGRGKSFLCWGVLGMICMAGLGCHFSVSYGLVKPPQPPTDGNGKVVPATPTNESGGSGIQPIVHHTGLPRQGETLNGMPTPVPGSPLPTPLLSTPGAPLQPAAPDVPRGTQGSGTTTPGTPAPGTHSADPALGLPPALSGPYAEAPPGGFPAGGHNQLPVEKWMKTHPPYVIEPPDILLIDAGRLIPKPPYIIQPLDVLLIQATETFPNQPINGPFVVGPDGTIALGFGYGTVRVSGMTLERAQAAVRAQLERTLRNPQVSLGLASFQTAQQVQGTHLVRQDGTISLGVYGCVYIAGMTLCQAQTVIEQHLSQFFQDPEISLDVYAYNSKAYYVIFDGGGYGQAVLKFPITGNETVLDAIYNAGGLPAVSSRRRIWVARPAPANHDCLQILPVDWLAITQGGSTRTNYQLFPGDRVYVRADPLIHLDNALAKIISPIERLFGITLLGTSVVRQFEGGNNGNGGVGIIGF